MIIHLTAGLIKKIYFDSVVRALKTLVALQRINMEVLGEILSLKLIIQIMQQTQILKIFHMSILQVLH